MKRTILAVAAFAAAGAAWHWLNPGRRTAPAEGAAGARVPLYYRSPMDPGVTSPTPRKDSMGMDYVPVFAEEASSSPVPGRATVTLAPELRQQIGVESAVVRRRRLAVVVRATGQVAYDPDLYRAISEYSEAVAAARAVKESPYPDVLQRADALVRAADLRLRQMGFSPGQIAAVAGSTQPPTNLLFGAPGGSVWVYAQVYEYEIPLVKPGQDVEVTATAYPGRVFGGVVESLDPILSAETRSLRARIKVPDPGGLLALQMYVSAEIHAELGRRLALPEGALIDTGTRTIVFVDRGDGRLEPRDVVVGRRAGGYYEVRSGLREGERVVTSANFLIDSESQMKAVVPGN
ncbi:MAG: efflux RND transporter periplasmic adaptor subunit [Elusimicrobia bacterium]|nr:efflux RND transporter periplasmic adaptor subunit [Elusimicrobiota bacterium]